MTNTVYRGLRITEDDNLTIDGEKHEFRKGDIVSTEERIARQLVNKSQIATYTGKQFRVNTEEVEGRVISNGENTSTSNDDEDEFSFEEYVDEHNVDAVTEDVESTDSVTWLENLRNHDERVTVKDAIDDRLEELEE